MDVIEKEFDYKGHHCVITFTEIGYRCGYITVDKTHDFYELPFTRINDTYKLTIKLSCAGRLYPKEDGNYWLGFTCDNRGDKPDINHVKEIWGEKPMVLTFLNMQKISPIPKTGTIRSVEYVEEKIKQLISEVDRYENG